MFPLVGIPQTIATFLQAYRDVFCRAEGFEHVKRYISGLLLSANKTLQGIYSHIAWPEGQQVSRRAMHEAVFEAGWDRAQHREVVAAQHRGRGREVMNLDWTFAYHPGSEKIFGAKEAYDYDQSLLELLSNGSDGCHYQSRASRWHCGGSAAAQI